MASFTGSAGGTDWYNIRHTHAGASDDQIITNWSTSPNLPGSSDAIEISGVQVTNGYGVFQGLHVGAQASLALGGGLSTSGVITIDGTLSGVANPGANAGPLQSDTIVNHGTINASSPTDALVIVSRSNSGTMTNDGLLEGLGAAGLSISTNVLDNRGGRVFASAGSKVSIASTRIIAGTLNTDGSGVINASDSTLDGSTGTAVTNTGLLRAPDNAATTLIGTITNSGTIDVQAKLDQTFTAGVVKIASSGVTLGGGGKVTLGGTLTSASGNATLTNTDNTISGGGTMGDEGGSTLLRLVNRGAIVANGISDTFSSGTMVLATSLGTTNYGSMTATGPNGLIISGTPRGVTVVDNAVGGTLVAQAGSHISLSNAVIKGSMGSVGNGYVEVISNPYANNTMLDGSASAFSLSGKLNIVAGVPLTLKGTVSNAAAIAVDSSALQIDATGVTLSGGGSIALSGSATIMQTPDSSATLTNTNNTIKGAGGIFSNDGGTLTLLNQGTIDANSSSGALTIGDGYGATLVQNTGTIKATGSGTLSFYNAVVNNQGGTISVSDGARADLEAITISGGTLSSAGTGYFQITGLPGAVSLGQAGVTTTSNATIKVGSSNSGEELVTAGSFINNGAIVVNGNGKLTAGGTLSGTGTVTLVDAVYSYLSGSLIDYGNVISGQGYIDATVDLEAGGVINANVAGAGLTFLGTSTIINNGLLEASAGTLTVARAVTGTGSALVTAGGTLSFASTFNQNVAFQGSNAGTLALAQVYGGKILNFLAGDRIDLTSLAYSASYTKTFTGNGSGGGTLRIMNGATVVASLALAGSYQSDAFTLANDGAGETLITTTGPSTYTLPGDVTAFGPATPNYTRYNDVTGNTLGDTIAGNASGPMTITGGSGADVLTFGANVTGGLIYGGAGNDRIDVSGEASTAASTYLDGGTGNDTLIGGGLNDTIVGNGADSMVGSTVAGAVNQFFDVSNGSTTMVGGMAATNRFHASGGNDKITAGNAGDFAWLTHAGADTFVGGTGNDTVSSQNSGYNSISTGGGNDLIYSASSHDLINTGDGANTVYAVSADQLLVYGGAGNDVIFVGGTYTSTGSGSSTVYNAIQVTGGGGNDTIDGSAGRGVLYIAPGTGSGVNVVTGDDVGNHIYGQFNTGQLYMRGGRGGDEMVGGQGGNTFIGAGGGDFVRAGGVANVFDFNSIGEAGLHIANFNASTDRIGIYAGGFGSQLYGGETLTAGYNLINGSTSTQQTGTFLYHDALLFFDPDGTGAIAPTALAGFTAGTNPVPTALSANNFTISGARF